MERARDDIYYQAMLARDHRFDGKFYIGVKTTGIYCRPICPAKPKRQNIEFFENALQAQEKGYRPCLRCRPESAPGSGSWLGTSAVVRRALGLLQQQIPHSEEQFATQFGMSARHLRRLFVNEIGLTPKQVFYHHRLNFARKLVFETNLPLTQVALSSGFRSLRRFNDAFKTYFERTPSQLRLNNSAKQELTLSLAYRPPFDWQALLDFYRAHMVIGIEEVHADQYQRKFFLEGERGHFTVRNDPNENRLLLTVNCSSPKVLFPLVQKVRKMFDLDSDPLLIEKAFNQCPTMKQLWQRYPGLRIPQAWEPFEGSICTILGQLVSLAQAQKLVAQLIEQCCDEECLFPTAQKIARSKFKLVKTTEKRKETLREFARRVCEQQLDLERPQESAQIKTQLLEIPGIGPWSAEYIALRALGDTDAFPASDLILKRALELHPEINLEQLRPWRAYVAMYLWREYAHKLTRIKT